MNARVRFISAPENFLRRDKNKSRHRIIFSEGSDECIYLPGKALVHIGIIDGFICSKRNDEQVWIKGSRLGCEITGFIVMPELSAIDPHTMVQHPILRVLKH